MNSTLSPEWTTRVCGPFQAPIGGLPVSVRGCVFFFRWFGNLVYVVAKSAKPHVNVEAVFSKYQRVW